MLYGIFSLYSIYGGFLLLFITSRHRGGGHKRLYRRIDFKRNKLAVLALVFVLFFCLIN